MTDAIETIHQQLKANCDQAYLANITKLVPSEKTVLGVKVPVIRNLVKDWKKSHNQDVTEVIELADSLFSRAIREEVLFGVLLLQKYQKQLEPALFETIDGWIDAIENWETCDQLAAITAPLIDKHPVLFEALAAMCESDNYWRRRFVLACSASLNHHGMSHPLKTIEFCRALAGDTEPMVEKAWHWAMREASKKDANAVYKCLLSLKGQVKKGVIRQAAEKLSDEQKAMLVNHD